MTYSYPEDHSWDPLWHPRGDERDSPCYGCYSPHPLGTITLQFCAWAGLHKPCRIAFDRMTGQQQDNWCYYLPCPPVSSCSASGRTHNTLLHRSLHALFVHNDKRDGCSTKGMPRVVEQIMGASMGSASCIRRSARGVNSTVPFWLIRKAFSGRT
jgi:hypothetical protein